MRILLSSRYLGSTTLEQLSFPVQLARLHDALIGSERLQTRTGTVNAREVDLLRHRLDRLDDIAPSLLAHGHLHAWPDAERLGQTNGHRIAGLECLRLLHGDVYTSGIYISQRELAAVQRA